MNDALSPPSLPAELLNSKSHVAHPISKRPNSQRSIYYPIQSILLCLPAAWSKLVPRSEVIIRFVCVAKNKACGLETDGSRGRSISIASVLFKDYSEYRGRLFLGKNPTSPNYPCTFFPFMSLGSPSIPISFIKITACAGNLIIVRVHPGCYLPRYPILRLSLQPFH